MAEGINVRLTGPLRKFVEQRSGPDGVYGSASEYIRDLIRHDFEAEEERRWKKLEEELRAGMEAGEDEFELFDPEQFLAEMHAKRAKRANANGN